MNMFKTKHLHNNEETIYKNFKKSMKKDQIIKYTYRSRLRPNYPSNFVCTLLAIMIGQLVDQQKDCKLQADSICYDSVAEKKIQ